MLPPFFVSIDLSRFPLLHQLNFFLWKYFLKFHRYFLGRRTGIHRDVSEEYHALTTALYWGRLFPVSIGRMRFALSQLSTWTTNEITSKTERVAFDMKDRIVRDDAAPPQPTVVNAVYVHSGIHEITKEPRKVIFWLYGGAFLSGDIDGNVSPAERVGKQTGHDMFVANYRLLPEVEFDDMLWDVLLAYRYLVDIRKIAPKDITVWGISSGASHCTRLLQLISQVERNIPTSPTWLASLLRPTDMPASGVLLCPFVDYTENTGSFTEYPKHDLVVNQSVIEEGVPYIAKVLGNGSRRRDCSPCYLDCTGLPPLCIVVSEHEAVYDHGVRLINKARSQGVAVTVGLWKYMCHVFCLLDSFCPEGRQSNKFCCDWIIEQQQAKRRAQIVGQKT